MAIQWMDDFTSYGSTASLMLNGSYADISGGGTALVTDPDPNSSTNKVLDLPAGASVRRVLSASLTTVGVLGRYYLDRLPFNTTLQPRFASIYDTSNNLIVWVTCDPSGYIQAYRLDTAGSVLIGTSTSPVAISNAWRHIECKFVIDVSAGSIDVRLEGQSVLSVSGIRTTSNVAGVGATAQNVVLAYNRSSGTVAGTLYVKDFIIWDSTGSVNNSFMGTCQVYKIVPDSDVSLNWTPSTGTAGWSLINESAPSDDTGYISAPNPAPSPALFTLTDLPTNVTAVKGVMAVTRSRKTDGGDGQLQLSLVSGANTGNGANRTITTAYTYWADIFDQDPGGSNWSKTLVNALQLKLNRTV